MQQTPQQTFRDRVTLARDGAVAIVTMDRAEKRNGLDLPMFQGLVDAGRAVTADPSIRAVVLTGDGPTFCAGLDFKAMMTGGAGIRETLLEREADSVANLAQRCAWVWQEVPVPVIAAIRGQAYGGGCQIALAADIRIVAPDAKLAVMEIKWGLIPDMSITQTLFKLVRPDIAKELMFTGRIVAAEEALSLGLATRIADDPVLAAVELAGVIATKNPHAIRHNKRLIEEAHGMPVKDAFLLETALQLELLGSKNQMEAVAANWQKRPPAFKDPEV